MADDFKIRGLKELEAAMDQIPLRVERNIARGGLRAAGIVFREEARRLVGVVSGALRKSIRVVSVRAKGGLLRAMVIAGRSGKGQPWYARLVEFGTAPHTIKAVLGKSLLVGNAAFATEVRHPGAAPKPFMRPAFDTKARQAVEAFREYATRRLYVLTGRSPSGE